MSGPSLYLDRYQLLKHLGKGGTGEVWLAHDLELKGDVALKFLSKSFSEKDTDMLRRETKNARLLSHRHILPVYDFHSQKDHPAAISMEYAPGGSLADLASREKRVFEVSELSDWIMQACEGFAYAHDESGIVHRDIKPGNLMLDATNSLKVADFGLSAPLAASLDDESEKVIGRRMTMHFASPQLIWNPYESHYLNDIFALGVTIFVLVAGSYPFDDPKNNRWKWDPDNLLSMSKRRQKRGWGEEPVPQSWDYAVAKCLAEDPADRPANMRELADLLGADDYYQRKSGKYSTVPIPAAEKEGKKDRRNFARSILVILVFLVTGVLAGVLWGAFQKQSNEDFDTTPTKEAQPYQIIGEE